MKVKIEFEIDTSNHKLAMTWLERVTLGMRTSRYLKAGSWKVETE